MPDNEPAPGNRGATHFWTSALFWTIVGSVAGVLAVVVGVAECASSNSPSPTPSASGGPGPATSAGPSAQPTTTAPPTVAHGVKRRIANVEGIDLDTGQIRDQNEPGVDMSPSRTGDSLNAMTHGAARFAIPRADAGLDRCTTIAPGAWTKTLDNVYHLPLDSHLCVQTDQGNLADLTLTHIPSAAEQYLEFDFTTWRAG
ncbi:hypothetical protein [Nocardia sp. XZ_19_369]|uniref:hypothetical protein n=1 Tax=Nocardia sp. XZ_19_369 TaxID=2769487 RepID=UPI00188DEB84|nr:hypothetical protein [Nocardia sp. XZ_19_369]